MNVKALMEGHMGGFYLCEESEIEVFTQRCESCGDADYYIDDIDIDDPESFVELYTDGFTIGWIKDIVELWCTKEVQVETFKAIAAHLNSELAEVESALGELQKGSVILLDKEFLDKYPDFPEHMSELSKFVYYRTYSRWLPEKGRRETWKETCARAVAYNCSLAETYDGEDKDLFDNMFNLKQFISGRSLWIGGTEAAKKAPLAGFNCSFVVIDSLKAFADLFYLLMVGTGVGFRILPSDVVKLPKFKQNIKLRTIRFGDEPWGNPATTLEHISDKSMKIIVGDSKEGWVTALEQYLEIMTGGIEGVENLYIDFSRIRPKGTPLKTFGGTASGYQSIQEMFEKIHGVIRDGYYSYMPHGGKLDPIHCLDICNIIGQNVVVGGVRRTSEIAIISPYDTDCINAKRNLTPDKYHRFMSNNSVYLEQKPTKEQLTKIFQSIRECGEPGFINVQEAKRRREDFAGMNPCAEIILPPNAVCNLTTINLTAFVDKDGEIDFKALEQAVKLSARAAYRMTCLDLELPEWNDVHHRDRLLGCSVTGYQDFWHMAKPSTKKQSILESMRGWTRAYADLYASELGTPDSLKVTAVKPEGTLSLVANAVSPGIHHQHAPYFIRRIRVNASDPLAKTALKLGWRVNPEVGQTWENATTLVVDFPCKSPTSRTKDQVSALEQLDEYRYFQTHYTEQNTSNTITVKPDEWEGVIDYVHTYWDDILAVTFLEMDSTAYPLMPYETCTKEEYEDLKAKMKPLDENILNNYEWETQNMGKEFEILDDRTECASGVCPIRQGENNNG